MFIKKNQHDLVYVYDTIHRGQIQYGVLDRLDLDKRIESKKESAA